MKLRPLITAAVVILLCNVAGVSSLYLCKDYLLPKVNFSANLANLGGSLITYATAMMALLLAMVFFIFSMDGPKLATFKKSGYLYATYLIYMITFLELGITIGLSILCLSNIQDLKVASWSLTFSLITFLLIGFLGLQLLNMKKNN